MLNYTLIFIICITASSLGAVCGVGGGIIIKPLLDFIGYADPVVCSFLSGCTVLAMACCSTMRIGRKNQSNLNIKKAAAIATGAAVGGACGKALFDYIKNIAPEVQWVGAIQAVVLALSVVMCIIYTLCKPKIKTHRLVGVIPGFLIGFVLGNISSFLGIGGGPINLIALHFFYGYMPKEAARYSLFIILISQIMSLATSFVISEIPQFDPIALAVVIMAGISGAAIGKNISRRIDNRVVDKLFLGFLVVVLLVCVSNCFTSFSAR